MVVTAVGFGAASPTSDFKLYQYDVKGPAEHAVHIKVLYCGICHSDIHVVYNEWGATKYPIVPGHEFTGIVIAVAPEVTKFKLNDKVAIGTAINSCRTCEVCKAGNEQLCRQRCSTYNGILEGGYRTKGGYGSVVIVHEDFVLRVPDKLPMADAAPLLCAGITTYAPLKNNNLDKGGFKVGVLGLGGLGHMAVQFAAKFNNEVTVITRSKEGKQELAKKLGAKHIISSSDPQEMEQWKQKLNFIIDTISAEKDYTTYLNLLDKSGIYVVVGAPPVGCKVNICPRQLLMSSLTVQGSLTGGIRQTQEMLDFCAENQILPMIELIKATPEKLKEAYDRVIHSDVKFRFVIDLAASIPESIDKNSLEKF